MIRNAMMWTLGLLMALAPRAFADDGSEGRVSGTISLWAGNTPVLNFFQGTKEVAGARTQLHVPLGQSHRWSVSPALGYAYGSWKDEQVNPPSSQTFQVTASLWDATLDFLHSSGPPGEQRFCLGPGLFYSSMTLKEKQTGMADVTFKPHRTVGAQLTAGGSIPAGSRLELTGSITERAGATWFDDKGLFNEDKYSAITYSTQFGIGLRVRF
jgi:hypothetical protein